jgi:hypothetical protein
MPLSCAGARAAGSSLPEHPLPSQNVQRAGTGDAKCSTRPSRSSRRNAAFAVTRRRLTGLGDPGVNRICLRRLHPSSALSSQRTSSRGAKKPEAESKRLPRPEADDLTAGLSNLPAPSCVQARALASFRVGLSSILFNVTYFIIR